MTVIAMRRRRASHPKGTYMHIKRDVLLEYVYTRVDWDLINAGKEHKVSPRKISQGLLAEKAMVHPSFINHLTAGRKSSCTPQVADRIAEALEVPLAVLFVTKKPTGGMTAPSSNLISMPAAA